MRRRTAMTFAATGVAGSLFTGRLAVLSGDGPQALPAGDGPGGATARALLDAPAWECATRYAATAFGRIAYVDLGRGDAALFLHGFPLSSFQWRGAVERLRGHRRCVAPDFLALGRTEVAAGQSVAPEAQARMLLALLDVLSIESVDVVANDSGGAVAQLLMVRHPERVRTVLLTNCDTERDSPPPALLPVIERARAGRFVDERLAPWLADKALARSAAGIGGMCYADPRHPTDEAIESYLAPLVASFERKELVHAYAIALEKNPLVGVEKQLRGSRVPTRVVWGAADTIFSAASPDYLDRTLGASRGVRRLEDRKLFFPEELPDVIAEEALALWGSSRN
jgi:haloalkane dehalogenase